MKTITRVVVIASVVLVSCRGEEQSTIVTNAIDTTSAVPELLEEENDSIPNVMASGPYEGYYVYNNEVKGFSIMVPDVWPREETPSDVVAFSAKSPPQGFADTFTENVNVICNDRAGDHLDLFFANAKRGLTSANTLRDVVVEDEQRVTIGNQETIWLKYSHTVPGFRIVVKVYAFYFNDMGYAITFTSQEESFSDYEALFDKIAESFKPL